MSEVPLQERGGGVEGPGVRDGHRMHVVFREEKEAGVLSVQGVQRSGSGEYRGTLLIRNSPPP
jgi:hypothetical protein